jgi:hypothetical protein
MMTSMPKSPADDNGHVMLTRGLLESAVGALWIEQHPLGPNASSWEAEANAQQAAEVSDRLWHILRGSTAQTPTTAIAAPPIEPGVFALVRSRVARFFTTDPP